jgi:hypothetical protein
MINNPDPKMSNKKKISFLRFLDDLQFKCIFHKQSGSGIKVEAGSRKNKILIHNTAWRSPQGNVLATLLFVVFINIEKVATCVDIIKKFANDTKWARKW